jgi:hypothetical protein
VARKGQTNQGNYVYDSIRKQHDLKVDSWGETYQVCCPFCGDTRNRLNFNYAYGTKDDKLEKPILSLVKCYNENCHQKEAFYRKVKDILEAMKYGGNAGGNSIDAPSTGPARVVRAELPGACIPLSELPSDHKANVFLRFRGYDPELVGRSFGLQYCVAGGRYTLATDRLVFPIYMEGKLKGWQARFLGEDAKGSVKDWYCCTACKHQFQMTGAKPTVCLACGQDTIRPMPKYYTMPGMQTGMCMFNFDTAATYPYIILCEGPLDPIQVGTPERPGEAGPAVCLFGHSLSNNNLKTLMARWCLKPLVLLLDPDVTKEQAELAKRLTGAFSPVINVVLPDNLDPGATPHKVIWKSIVEEANKQGCVLVP